MTWDIFCNVIDNYGDIGVSWRLSRQLAGEYGIPVRLWVDDLQSFIRIHPDAKPVAVQHCLGVEVRAWGDPFPDVAPGDVVIEAFGCQLPESFVAAMARTGPLWINLEYLSAESWVRSAHLMPSPHPRLPLVKHFFFPGFFSDTGGLPVERGLLGRRDAFLSDPEALSAFWEKVGGKPDSGIAVSLFGYDNPALASLFDAWAEGGEKVLCLIPESRLADEAKSILGAGLNAGNLEARILPFFPQTEYDPLLWACDVNFVRGEDSFVRAQWAAKPFVWQIYPQRDGIHMEKLDAFLDLYCEGRAFEAPARRLWHAWNRGGDAGAAWAAFRGAFGEISGHGRGWADRLSGHSLAAALLDYSLKKG